MLDVRLAECENDEASDEDCERHESADEDGVTPAHVVRPAAASLARGGDAARVEAGVTGIARDKTPRDEGSDGDSERLESRQRAEKEAAVLR